MRYGSIDPTTKKSLTHLEYDEAQRIGLPSLIYLLDEQRQPVLPAHVEFGDGAEKLKTFKATLREQHVVSLFTTPEDLAAKITGDVPALAERSGFEVRDGELSKIIAAIPRIDWLNDERFAFLKRELTDAATSLPSDALLREVFEFLLRGDRQAAVFLIARATGVDLGAAIDSGIAIENRLKAVVQRGLKIMEAKAEAVYNP